MPESLILCGRRIALLPAGTAGMRVMNRLETVPQVALCPRRLPGTFRFFVRPVECAVPDPLCPPYFVIRPKIITKGVYKFPVLLYNYCI